MSVPLGSIRIVRGGQEDVLLPFARVRAQAARYDRAQHRAPYGTAWFTSGSRQQHPHEIEITLRVESGGVLSSAAMATRNVVALIRAADVIETPVIDLTSPVVLSRSASPAGGGAYRVSLRVSGVRVTAAVVMYGEETVMYGGVPVTYGGG